DLMVFLATPARICIVWVSGTSLGYGNVESEKVLRAVVLPLACHDDLLLCWFAIQSLSPKASGPGLTVRIADNRTGARMDAIIGIAFSKSSGIFGILHISRAPRP
ncbi:MAG TPA: hypothetical protein VF864_04365, partial [Gemmatimonadales bacterium]